MKLGKAGSGRILDRFRFDELPLVNVKVKTVRRHVGEQLTTDFTAQPRDSLIISKQAINDSKCSLSREHECAFVISTGKKATREMRFYSRS